MLLELEAIRDLTPETIDWLGDSAARALRSQMLSLPSNAPIPQQFAMRQQLANLELRLGNEGRAIELLQECQEVLDTRRMAIPPQVLSSIEVGLHFQRAVAYMRLGETQNCCQRNNADSCIVPIRGAAIHDHQQGSREALRSLAFVLENGPKNSEVWYRAIWLYNIAKMTVGEFPDGVPEHWRLPEETFQTTESFAEFSNVALDRGIATFSLAGGAIADDLDGDGWLDLMVSTMDTAGQTELYLGGGDGSFRRCTSEAKLVGLFGGLNLLHVDYDNDGFNDVLILRGGWFQGGGRHPNSLLHNNGDGTFTDVTFDAGLATRAPTQTAAWADCDNDGDLDLYIGNETTPQVAMASQLFRNEGDGTFTDVAESAGVLNDRFAKSVVWGDFNHDRWPDLFVSNLGQNNRLYQNGADGTFVDVASELNVNNPQRSFPAWFWDVNNDGHLDIFVSSYADDVAWLAAEHLGVLHDAERPKLYLGTGRDGFVEASERYGLSSPIAPMGCNFGDVDNDGYLDCYLGTGEPEYHNLMPNIMYHNQGGERFVDVTVPSRLGHLQKGHAVAFADFDQDGDLDIFEQLGGAFPGDRFYDALFDNPGFGNNWLKVRVVGTRTNRSGIGVRLHLVLETETGTRSIYRHVNSGGSFGANPFCQTIGIGSAKSVKEMAVYWPATDETQFIRDIPVNQQLDIVEN
ncbi:MAG: CRTAC1 family protein [Planctomycetales bacterium]|nr:CRTAC1 family protein [Planctomycetales bacterium]